MSFSSIWTGGLRQHPPDATAENRSCRDLALGEDLKSGRVDRKPPGTVRYALAKTVFDESTPIIVAPQADARNTQTHYGNTPPAVLTPPEWGGVLPFRWVEIEGWPGELQPRQIVRKSALCRVLE